MAVRKAIVSKTAAPVAPKAVEKKEVVHREVPNIKAMDFVPIWQKSPDQDSCNQHFGRSGMWASSFACRLRKMGVNLKKMPMGTGGGGGGKRIDVDELNALIK